jgi:glucose-1-phosphate adenylyltransferase
MLEQWMALRDLNLAAPSRTLALILAGGRGARLMDLTSDHSKPGLDFAGKFKVVDFALSNCVNSNFRKVLVMTQYNSHGLLNHLQRGWSFLSPNIDEFVRVCPAQQSLDNDAWYAGTADAVFQNLPNIQSHGPENVLILAGDHIYKMDYRRFLMDHIEQDADMTIACLEVPKASAREFGIPTVDASDRITGFVEKPQDPPTLPGRPDTSLASMGIYLFKAEPLYRALALDAVDPTSSHDFGKDVIPRLIREGRVFAHPFDRSAIPNAGHAPYWRDVGTVDAYWEANMDLTRVEPELNLYDDAWPVLTYQEQLAGAKFVHSGSDRQGSAVSSIVSGACIISGASVRDSFLFSRVRVHSHARLDEAIVLPGADIGVGARLRKVVVARGTRIPEGLEVGADPILDAERFHRTPGGVTLISQRMLDRL